MYVLEHGLLFDITVSFSSMHIGQHHCVYTPPNSYNSAHTSSFHAFWRRIFKRESTPEEVKQMDNSQESSYRFILIL